MQTLRRLIYSQHQYVSNIFIFGSLQYTTNLIEHPAAATNRLTSESDLLQPSKSVECSASARWDSTGDFTFVHRALGGCCRALGGISGVGNYTCKTILRVYIRSNLMDVSTWDMQRICCSYYSLKSLSTECCPKVTSQLATQPTCIQLHLYVYGPVS